MNDDTRMVIFCNSNVAKELVEDFNPELRKEWMRSIVISEMFDDDMAVVAPAMSFLDYIKEHGSFRYKDGKVPEEK